MIKEVDQKGYFVVTLARKYSFTQTLIMTQNR